MSSDLTEAERDIAVCNAIDDAWDDLCACLQATQRSAKRLQRLMRVCGMRLPADEARGHIRFFGGSEVSRLPSAVSETETPPQTVARIFRELQACSGRSDRREDGLREKAAAWDVVWRELGVASDGSVTDEQAAVHMIRDLRASLKERASARTTSTERAVAAAESRMRRELGDALSQTPAGVLSEVFLSYPSWERLLELTRGLLAEVRACRAARSDSVAKLTELQAERRRDGELIGELQAVVHAARAWRDKPERYDEPEEHALFMALDALAARDKGVVR